LSTATAWQSWLRKHHPTLYADQLEQMRAKPGCKQNRLKMLEILRKITADPISSDVLEDFLRHNFPYIIKEEPDDEIVMDLVRDIPVFGYYDPALATIPRRIILSDKEPSKLEDLVQRFLVDKAAGDYVVVGHRAYVEYLPPSLGHLAAQTPDKNWLVKVWRAEHQTQSANLITDLD